MLNLISRAIALVIATGLAATFLVKVPFGVFWNIEPDHEVTLGWVLCGVLLIPGTAIALVLGYVAFMRCRALVLLDRRMRAREQAGEQQA